MESKSEERLKRKTMKNELMQRKKMIIKRKKKEVKEGECE